MHEIVSNHNPLMNFSYQVMPTEGGTKGKGVYSHFDKESRLKAPVGLCRNARVSLTRNLWQEVGLYNGATGTIVDIRMFDNTSPLSADFPVYIIVQMDTQDLFGIMQILLMFLFLSRTLSATNHIPVVR